MPPYQDIRRYSAFLSYVRADDDNDNGRITKFRRRLASEVRMQTGQDFPIFQDKTDIFVGQRWRTQIEHSIDDATLLIAMITPSYLKSEACREEWKLFRERERQLNRDDLIIPVLYVTTPSLKNMDDPIAMDLDERQRFDWRSFRFEDFESNRVRQRLADLASQIVSAIETSGQLTPTTTTVTHFDISDGEDLGFLEVLAAAEDASPALVLTINSLTDSTHQISERVVLATSELESANDSGKPTSVRVSIVHRLSRRLEEPVGNMENLVEEFLDQVTRVDGGIALLIDRVPFFSEEELKAAAKLLKSLESMKHSSMHAFRSLEGYQNSLVRAYPISSALRPILQRIYRAIDGILSSRPTFESWHTCLESALD